MCRADSRTQGKAVDPPRTPSFLNLLQVYAFCLNCSPLAPASRMHARAAGGTWRGVLIAQPEHCTTSWGGPGGAHKGVLTGRAGSHRTTLTTWAEMLTPNTTGIWHSTSTALLCWMPNSAQSWPLAAFPPPPHSSTAAHQ